MPVQNLLGFLRSWLGGGNAADGRSVGTATPDGLQRALALLQQGMLDEAEVLYRSLQRQEPNNADVLQFLGVIEAQRGHMDEAMRLMDRALAIAPDHAAAHANHGNLLRILGRHEEALADYGRALTLDPQNSEALFNRAAALTGLGQLEKALTDYETLLAIEPGNLTARLRRCEVLTALRRYGEALVGYEAVHRDIPEDVDVLFHCGVLLARLRRYAEAVEHYDRALLLRPDYAEILNNRGIALWNARRYVDAVESYDRALAVRSDYADAHYNRGIALAGLNQHADAIASYDRAIVCNPSYARAYSNRGAALVKLEQLDAALDSYDRALALDPRLTDALNNRAGLFRRMGLHDRAGQDYASLLELDPEYEHAAGNKLYSDAWCCHWECFSESLAVLRGDLRAGKPVVLPFQAAILLNVAAEHLNGARIYAARRYPSVPWTSGNYCHDRIRVAYLSADFRDHATTHLMAELFEQHDRSRFEVSAWSFGPDVQDAMRVRLQQSFEQFNEVRNLSDMDIVALLRDQEIDIAVDLKGFTDGCRPAIFAQRVAPIQVNYLGYPGTTGADYMDYIIADPEVIPEDHDRFYAEKVVRLPDSYQVNDSGRVISGQTPSRAQAGLPDSGFVFCCFNNNYKITPEVFAVWMRLLQRVEGSVLWLLEDNAVASRNLKREAEGRGVDAGRLVFATRMLPPDHLARHRLADLFLDTLPCNAHTTASDALWAGLPVLTCRGHAFPGRVAASLLRAIGLPELITETLADYEALALKLATTPALLADIKSRLAKNKTAHPLFDIDRYRRHIESAYGTMHERYQRGELAQSFSVKSVT